MDPYIKAVRELQAKEELVARIVAIAARLDALEPKLDAILAVLTNAPAVADAMAAAAPPSRKGQPVTAR